MPWGGSVGKIKLKSSIELLKLRFFYFNYISHFSNYLMKDIACCLQCIMDFQ